MKRPSSPAGQELRCPAQEDPPAAAAAGGGSPPKPKRRNAIVPSADTRLLIQTVIQQQQLEQAGFDEEDIELCGLPAALGQLGRQVVEEEQAKETAEMCVNDDEDSVHAFENQTDGGDDDDDEDGDDDDDKKVEEDMPDTKDHRLPPGEMVESITTEGAVQSPSDSPPAIIGQEESKQEL